MSHARKTGGPRPTTLRIVPPPAPLDRPTDAVSGAAPHPPPAERAPVPFDAWSDATASEFADLLSELRAIPPSGEVPDVPAPVEPTVPSPPDGPSIPEPSVPQPDEPATPVVPADPVVPIDPVPSPEVPDPDPGPDVGF